MTLDAATMCFDIPTVLHQIAEFKRKGEPQSPDEYLAVNNFNLEPPVPKPEETSSNRGVK